MAGPRPSRTLLIPLALAALYVGVRLASLTRWDFWFDELFGVELGRLDWAGLLAATAADQTNPPGFYLLVKGWMELGGTAPGWLRLLPFLCALLGLLAMVRLVKILQLDLGSRVTALALVALSPMLVFYSVELRAYALLFALGTAATAECAAIVLGQEARRGPVIRLALWNLLLPLTHYFGWTVIAAEWGAFLLLAPKQVKVRLLVTLPAVAAFVPWAFEVAEAAADAAAFAPTISWIPKPGIREVLNAPAFLVSTLSVPIDLAAGALATLGIILGASQGAPETRKTRLLLALFVAIPATSAFAASWLLPRSLWMPRNLIGAAAPALILLSFSLRGGRGRLAAGAVALWCVLGLVVGGGQARKTPWRSITAQLEPTGSGSLPVYAYEGYVELPIRYYAEQDARRLDVRPLTASDSMVGREGWLVIRPSYWPGRADRGSVFLERYGMRVTDSAETGPEWERVESWRWAKE
jgi:mannosyltransferase